MERRTRMQTSEASAYSVTNSIKDLVLHAHKFTTMAFMSDDDIKNSDAQTILSRMLSTRTEISTTSTLAREFDEAANNIELRKWVHIGQGQCGTVFALSGTNDVVKIPNNPAKEDVLYQDARMHALVDKAFQEAPTELRANIAIPQYRSWVQPGMENWWGAQGKLFPSGYQTPTYGLVSQRIFPLPVPVRKALIDSFCPKGLRKSVQANPENKDCLVRVYLGKREPGKRLQEKTFRLRNLPLLVNDLEDLSIDVLGFTQIMADALAILHWKANVDGNDVEFVLGSTPSQHRNAVGPDELQIISKDSPTHKRADVDFFKRSAHLWLLDFNQCTMISPEKPENCLELLTKAFWFNDPYFPRPVSNDTKDKALWEAFVDRYLFASQHLTSSSAPAEFIKSVEDEGARRREKLQKQGKGSLLGALTA